MPSTMLSMTPAEFERIVREAVHGIPDDLRHRLENISLIVEEEPSEQELLEVGLDPGFEELPVEELK